MRHTSRRGTLLFEPLTYLLVVTLLAAGTFAAVMGHIDRQAEARAEMTLLRVAQVAQARTAADRSSSMLTFDAFTMPEVAVTTDPVHGTAAGLLVSVAISADGQDAGLAIVADSGTCVTAQLARTGAAVVTVDDTVDVAAGGCVATA